MSERLVLQSTLFTNDVGLVIFGDNDFRQLINLPNPFRLVWRNLDEVLGISNEFAETIIERSEQSGHFELAQLQIRRREDAQQDIRLASDAAYDSDGKFAGVNLRLEHDDAGAAWRAAATPEPDLEQTEHEIIRKYFFGQLGVLKNSLEALGGPRFRSNLNTVISSSAAPYQWPVHVRDNDLVIEADALPVSVYRGLLARGIAYARSILGMRFLIEKMVILDEDLDEAGYALVTRSGLRELYEDLP